jgi:hypothetical protein
MRKKFHLSIAAPALLVMTASGSREESVSGLPEAAAATATPDSQGTIVVYPAFLRTDNRRKSRRLSAEISVREKIYFRPYEKIFPSLRKFSCVLTEIFFRPYGNFHASLRSFFIPINV